MYYKTGLTRKEEEKILKKASRTTYRHNYWYIGTKKSVLEIMMELIKSNDFCIEATDSINEATNALRIAGYRPPHFEEKEDVTRFYAKKNRFNGLQLRDKSSLYWSPKYVDRGELKIATYLILQQRWNEGRLTSDSLLIHPFGNDEESKIEDLIQHILKKYPKIRVTRYRANEHSGIRVLLSKGRFSKPDIDWIRNVYGDFLFVNDNKDTYNLKRYRKVNTFQKIMVRR